MCFVNSKIVNNTPKLLFVHLIKLNYYPRVDEGGNLYTSGSSYEKLPLFQYKSSSYIPLRQTNIINQCKHEKASFEIIIENFDLYYGFLVINQRYLPKILQWLQYITIPFEYITRLHNLYFLVTAILIS